MTLGSESFPFDPLQAQTLMVAPLNEPFLTSNGNVRSESIIGASWPAQSRIFAPGMNEDISLVEMMFEVLSKVTSAKGINSTLPFRDHRPMNGIRNRCEL